MNEECETCIKRKTPYCPTSIECMATDDKPYYQDRIMILEENEQLKLINKEYERLNKENGRGFKITNVQEYNIDELLSYKKYKDNWNKLREWIVYNKHNENTEQHYLVVDYGTLLGKMRELEGSDSNGQ